MKLAEHGEVLSLLTTEFTIFSSNTNSDDAAPKNANRHELPHRGGKNRKYDRQRGTGSEQRNEPRFESGCVKGAYRGWKISPEGYAKFLDYFDPSQNLLSTPPADWPGFATRTGRGHSIGINIRNGADFFHFGDFMWSNPRTSYGAYYAMWHQGVRFVVTYTPNIDHALVDELDAALYRAAFQ